MIATDCNGSSRLDAAQVDQAVGNRWREVITAITGIDPAKLDGKGHPCPACGDGTDRFSVFADFDRTGGVICRHCHSTNNGDGFATIMMLLGCDFPEAVRLVGEYLHLAPATSGKPKQNGKPKKVYPTREKATDTALWIVQQDHPGATLASEWTYYRGGEIFGVSLRFNLGVNDAETDKPLKQFRPIRRLDTGEWIIGKGDGAWPLYGVDELPKDGPVLLVEGEKAAQALLDVGAPAVTWQGGSKAVAKADFTALAGREVAIGPDNDAAGAEAVHKIVAELAKLTPAPVVKVFEWPNVPPKGDACEYLDGWTDTDGNYHRGCCGDAAEPEDYLQAVMNLVADAEPAPSEPVEAIDQENPYRRKPIERFDICDLVKAYPQLNPPVVDGLFREGETVNLISTSKVGKSWLVYYIAICIAFGHILFDRFKTTKGRVLLVDNELHPQTLASRVPRVIEALGYDVAKLSGLLEVWPLRGDLRSLEELGEELEEIEPGTFKAIILDAKYRFIADGASENDNAAETRFYNQLDRLAAKTGAAFILVHHASKGSQTEKRVTDVGSGAGAQSRAADCHLVLREHEDDNAVVLAAAVRSFAPVDPLVLRWDFPLWTPDSEADPKKLKGRLGKGQQNRAEEDQRDKLAIIDAMRNAGERVTNKQLRKTVGMGQDKLSRLLDKLESEGALSSEQVTKRGNPCDEFWLCDEPPE